jgi:hypothetical protein
MASGTAVRRRGEREKRRAMDGRKVMKDTTLHTKVPVCV